MLSKTQKGLSHSEAIKRLKKYGYNEIPEKNESSWQRLFKKLWGPIPGMIELAALLSAITCHWEDFTIIIVLLIVNIFVDYAQETKADNALKILKEKLAKKATVLRDNKFQEIDARYLVPDDIIKLKIGDIIPADAQLISGKYLEVDQSVLTGESMPVDKKKGDNVYSNSIVKMGEMLAQVTKTGLNTFFGKSTTLVAKAIKEKKSHFQKAVIRVGNFLIILTATMAVTILIVAIFRQDNLMEVFRFILVLVVASIPVALPAVLSVTMAVGAISIAKHQAIVSNLPAIEELAGIDILCTDKTGTLTQNKMSISKIKTYANFSEKDLFTYAVLASQKENEDPIEKPLLEYFDKHYPQNEISNYQQQDFSPFDPICKKTEAVLLYKEKTITVAKGAPQVITNMCTNKKIQKELSEDVKKFAQKGYRTLAVAIKKDSSEFECVGLIPLFDPPRQDSAKVIKEVKRMGIGIKMLTGDNHAIAEQTAKVLHIGEKILSSLQFKKNPSAIEKADGFSQVLPEDKYLIINELQKKNHIVAMTGDGVNDAPALKKADVGMAVSGATDAARAAADLVLLAPGLSVINYSIQIARKTFERMKSYAIFRIAETMRIILFMSFSIIVFNFYPITAVMIVILALLNDIPVMMIAYDNASINNKPVRWNMKEVLIVATVLGIAGVTSSFLLFYWLYTHNYSLALIQSLLFIKLDVAGHSTIYLTRTGKHHFWNKPFPSLKFFLPAFSSRAIGTLVAVYGIFMLPIGWKYAFYMWSYALVWWIFNDMIKVFTYKILDKNKNKILQAK
jgi:H+-transporting ATPase